MSDELPQGWATAPLSQLTKNPKQDIVSGPFGSNLKSDEYVAEGVPIIRLQNVDRNRFLEKNMRFITPQKARELSAHNFRAGDVVISKLGDPLGKACIVPESLPHGIVVADVVRVRIDENRFCKPYAVLAINSPSVVNQINLEMMGSTRPRVNLNHLRGLELPLAPLAEQRRIVVKLEKLLGKVDACQQRLAKIAVLLKRFRQSVLAAACSGRLTADWREEKTTDDTDDTDKYPSVKSAKSVVKKFASSEAENADDFPDTWRTAEFSEVIESSFYGPRFSKESYSTKGIPTIRTTDMGFDGSIELKDSPCISMTKNELEKFGLQDGDLVVTRTGATIGKCALYDKSLGPVIPGAYLIRFRFKRNAIVPKFALRFLMSPVGQRLLVGGSTAVAQPNVNATTISQFVIPIPPLAEQQEIVRRVEGLFALADQIEARFAKAKAQVDKLTPSLLARAFRGQLVPQDPTDEPASVLLERIRQATKAR